jgi:hypothetical protein
MSPVGAATVYAAPLQPTATGVFDPNAISQAATSASVATPRQSGQVQIPQLTFLFLFLLSFPVIAVLLASGSGTQSAQPLPFP